MKYLILLSFAISIAFSLLSGHHECEGNVVENTCDIQ